jgi:acyl-CoA thioester hydrolase
MRPGPEQAASQLIRRPLEITLILYCDNAKAGVLRHRLSRQLSALHGARPHQPSAADGRSQHALFEQAQEETPGFAFVVRSMALDFFRPARMDDVLDVVTWPVAVKGASITLAQEVRRGDEVLVKAAVRVAFISEGRAKPIPKSLRQLMKADLASD